MSQWLLNPKIRFLGQKMCSVAHLRTDTQTDTHTHRSDYCGHPFRFSGVFPTAYHQGSAQKEGRPEKLPELGRNSQAPQIYSDMSITNVDITISYHWAEGRKPTSWWLDNSNILFFSVGRDNQTKTSKLSYHFLVCTFFIFHRSISSSSISLRRWNSLYCIFHLW